MRNILKNKYNYIISIAILGFIQKYALNMQNTV